MVVTTNITADSINLMLYWVNGFGCLFHPIFLVLKMYAEVASFLGHVFSKQTCVYKLIYFSILVNFSFIFIIKLIGDMCWLGGKTLRFKIHIHIKLLHYAMLTRLHCIIFMSPQHVLCLLKILWNILRFERKKSRTSHKKILSHENCSNSLQIVCIKGTKNVNVYSDVITPV